MSSQETVYTYIEDGAVKLVSRRGHVYKSFRTLCESIAVDLRVKEAILDGEIVCLDQEGHSQFNKLMYRRGEARFYAFDLLWLNGEDLRSWRLLGRKAALRNIVPTKSERLLLADENSRAFVKTEVEKLEGYLVTVRDEVDKLKRALQ